MQGRIHSGGGGAYGDTFVAKKKEEDKGRIKKGLLLKLRSVQLFFSRNNLCHLLQFFR